MVVRIFLIFLSFFNFAVYSTSGKSSVEGTVTAEKTGAPIEFAEVKIDKFYDDDFVPRRKPTNSQGTYYFDNLDQGKYVISVTALGYDGDSEIRWLPMDKSEPVDFQLDTAKCGMSIEYVGYVSELSMFALRIAGNDGINGSSPFLKLGPVLNSKWQIDRLHFGANVLFGLALANDSVNEIMVVTLNPLIEFDFFGADNPIVVGISPAVDIFFGKEFKSFGEPSVNVSVRWPKLLGKGGLGFGFQYYLSDVRFPTSDFFELDQGDRKTYFLFIEFGG